MPHPDAGVLQGSSVDCSRLARMADIENSLPERVRETVVLLLRELVDGPPGREAYVLNPGDRGLLASLD